MSESKLDWNPLDGPAPDDDERGDARSLADALGGRASASRELDASLEALRDVALRVKATAHPDADKSKAIASAAVHHAVTHREQGQFNITADGELLEKCDSGRC